MLLTTGSEVPSAMTKPTCRLAAAAPQAPSQHASGFLIPCQGSRSRWHVTQMFIKNQIFKTQNFIPRHQRPCGSMLDPFINGAGGLLRLNSRRSDSDAQEYGTDNGSDHMSQAAVQRYGMVFLRQNNSQGTPDVAYSRPEAYGWM